MGATKRDWTVTDDGTVVCFASEKYTCVVVDDPKAVFAVATEITAVHDESLARATKELNEILGKTLTHLTTEKKDHRHLSLLVTHKGLFLAWTRGGFTADSEDGEVDRALKLK